jgi:acetyl-CoA carboxylase biotin carboxylase subunit
MNTRLQVEHPVTELVTSQDLVKLQIRIAYGELAPVSQEDVTLRGHAMECRIYAEDPHNNFFPSPGRILDWHASAGPGIRCDDGVYSGWTVPNEYDPMLGKLISYGRDRAEAISRLQGALAEFYASGIKTNAELFRRILCSPDFQRGQIYTRWLDDFLAQSKKAPVAAVAASEAASNEQDAATIAAVLWYIAHTADSPNKTSVPTHSESRWKLEARREQLRGEIEY